jgi:hypothetical protein
MNTLALDRLGISSATPDRVDNVWIEKDAAGEPTGRLHGSVTNYYCDSPFMNGLLRQLPLFQAGALVPGTERAMRASNAMGVTTIYEAHLMTFSLIEVYRWLRSQNRLTLRVLCTPEAEPVGVPWTDPLQPADYVQRLERARELVDRSDDLFRIDGLAVSPYGPCWPGFALMREPYQDPYGQPTWGTTMVSPDKVEQAIRFSFPTSSPSPGSSTPACTSPPAPTGDPRTYSSTSPWPSRPDMPPAGSPARHPASAAARRWPCGPARPPTSCAGTASARSNPAITPTSWSSTATR